MKKQILFLVMALIASVTVTFGQAPNLTQAIASCPAPTAITATCVANAGKFSPIAGTQYTYTANVPTTAGAVTYHWFVTTDLNLIATGGALTSAREAAGTSNYVASGSGTYNTVSNATAPSDVSVDITWKAFTHDPLAPVLLVVYVVDAAGCVNDNIEAFLIRPVHAFTLDIANLAEAGTLPGASYPTCVSTVETATYVITNAATGEGEIQFDYGTNYMFFIVTAANYTDSWLPRFQVDGAGLTGSSRLVTAVDWAYPADAFGATATWVTSMTGAGTAASIFTGTAPVEAQATTGSVGATGECIVVRLTIANNQDETIVDEAITLAVDGVMNDPTTAAADYTNTAYADIHHAAGPASECPYFDLFTNDVATQILTARPDINAIAPDVFVPTDRD